YLWIQRYAKKNTIYRPNRNRKCYLNSSESRHGPNLERDAALRTIRRSGILLNFD
ncbi:hypothetical protein S245_063907, partial [Arachis hypogaea]